MILLILTERIRRAIQTAIECPDFDTSVKKRLLPVLRGEVKVPTTPVMTPAHPTEGSVAVDTHVADGVPLELVKEVSSFLVSREVKMGNEVGLSQYWLHELLAGTTVYNQPKSTRMNSPELLTRLETVITDKSNAGYRTISNIMTEEPMHYFFNVNQADVRELRAHLSAVINATITIVVVFVALYAVSKAFTHDVSLRVLLGLFGALLVAFAEAWLYMRHVQVSKPARQVRRRRSSRISKRRSSSIPHGQSNQMPQ